MVNQTLRLNYIDIIDATVHRNASEDELIQTTINDYNGKICDTGALMIDTGKFTGRSPKDRFIVKDEITKNSVYWGDINIPIEPKYFDVLYSKITDYLSGTEVYVRDVAAGADSNFQIKVRVVNELPWQNLFARNMFIGLDDNELQDFSADWHVIAAPGFLANPKTDGTRNENFSIINFTKRIIIIGGTAYTGEIKKGVFSVLNFYLPKEKGVFSMHCSSNQGPAGDTAIFFGLSGTGKTTLSATPDRRLIGDDEHGWSDQGIFNFEGGCYAKTINLSPTGEPEIYNAITKGALTENMRCIPGTDQLDYTNDSITPNIRVSYPLSHIPDAVIPSMGKHPNHIFMLTYDAFGVLPPISKLNRGQAMYQFISGFTSKVAGTEEGVEEPRGTFSACYGEPFMPLHPMEYAKMLGDRMTNHETKVWLVNTGLIGGKFGVGKRIKLAYTRALIQSALDGELDQVEFEEFPVFGFDLPTSCKGVPSEILNPRNQWQDKKAYDEQLHYLAEAFCKNFKKFSGEASPEVLAATPILSEVS